MARRHSKSSFMFDMLSCGMACITASKWFGSAASLKVLLSSVFLLHSLMPCFFLCRPGAFSSRSRPRAFHLERSRGTLRGEQG